MKKWSIPAFTIAVFACAAVGATTMAVAQDVGSRRTEVSLLGGVQVLNENDSAFPDQSLNIPAVASLAYHLGPIFAIEGEFTWIIPLEQSVTLESGQSEDRKTPDILVYQASLRAHLQRSESWSPYLAAGAGALTVLSNTDADRLPVVSEDETMFAVNFGAGLVYNLDDRWGLRADYREIVAFPSSDASGLSNGGDADEIWMGRGTLGATYHF